MKLAIVICIALVPGVGYGQPEPQPEPSQADVMFHRGNDLLAAAATLKDRLLHHLACVGSLSTTERLRQRYAKYRAFGQFTEKGSVAA